MPAPEIFDALLERRQGCSAYPDPVENYDSSLRLSALIDKAPYDSDGYDDEVYAYVRHVLDVLDADETLTPAQRGEIGGRVMALMTYGTCFDERVVERAWDDHYDEVARRYDRDALRLFGIAVIAAPPTERAARRWPK